MSSAAELTVEERSASTWRIAQASFLAGGAVLALVWPEGEVSAQIRNGSIAALCMGLAGAFLITHRTGLLPALAVGRLGPWASLSFALIFGLASLQWTTPQVTGFSRLVAQSSVATALELLTWAWGAWILGYLAGVLNPLRAFTNRVVDLAIPPATALRMWRPSGVWLLFVTGLVGQGLRLLTNSFGYLQNAETAVTSFSGFGQIVSILSTMGIFAVVLAGVSYFSPDLGGSLGVLVFVAAIEAMFAVVQGTKEGVAVVVIAIVLSYAKVHGRVPVAFLVLGALIFAFAVLPFVTNYRDLIRGGTRDVGAGEAIRLIPTAVDATVDERSFEQAPGRLAARLRGIDSLAIVMQKSPDMVDYEPLKNLAVQPVVGLVPRLLWPGKPGYTGSYEFGQIYYSAPRDFYSAWAITPPADLYRHGGPLPLVAGMILLGGLYRLLDDALRPSIDFRHLFLIVALFPAMVKHEIDIASLLLNLPVSLFGVAVAIRALALVGERRAKMLA